MYGFDVQIHKSHVSDPLLLKGGSTGLPDIQALMRRVIVRYHTDEAQRAVTPHHSLRCIITYHCLLSLFLL